MDIWTAFFYIVIMVAVLVAAYFTTRFLAQKGRRMSSRHILMHDCLTVGRDRQIALIEVGGRTLLVGITNQAINLIAEVDPEELALPPVENAQQSAGGFAAKAEGFLSGLKNAPDKLSKARMEQKRVRREQPAKESDFLSQMEEAIKRHKSQEDDASGEDK